jgi:methionine sulfoxide reductase catalytic subunit
MIREPDKLDAREITPEGLYLRRREFIRNSLQFAATSTGVGATLLWLIRGLRTTAGEKSAAAGTTADRNALTIAKHADYA